MADEIVILNDKKEKVKNFLTDMQLVIITALMEKVNLAVIEIEIIFEIEKH